MKSALTTERGQKKDKSLSVWAVDFSTVGPSNRTLLHPPAACLIVAVGQHQRLIRHSQTPSYSFHLLCVLSKIKLFHFIPAAQVCFSDKDMLMFFLPFENNFFVS